MGKRSRTDASDRQSGQKARDIEEPPVQPIKAWRPSRLKTGLRNHSIGRKVSIITGPSS
jgi:hypothetical protein